MLSEFHNILDWFPYLQSVSLHYNPHVSLLECQNAPHLQLEANPFFYFPDSTSSYQKAFAALYLPTRIKAYMGFLFPLIQNIPLHLLLKQKAQKA